MDLRDPFLNGLKIDTYMYVENRFLKRTMKPGNLHGTEIGKILFREAPTVEVISLQILDKDNRCKVEALIAALEFCIQKRVDIINMSLGITVLPREKFLKLEKICAKVEKAGIIAFAAHNNDEKKESYPANFKTVVGVKANIMTKEFCEVDLENKDMIFADSLLYVPRMRHQICKGNSYLTAFVVGIYCNYVETRMDRVLQKEFLLKDIYQLYQDNTMKRIFFDKIKDRNTLNDKNVVFYTDFMEENNLNILNMYREVCEIREYSGKIESIREFYKIIKGCNIFYIGVLSMEFVYREKVYIKKLLEAILKRKIPIITIFPVLNVKERQDLANKYNGEIKSIYK